MSDRLYAISDEQRKRMLDWCESANFYKVDKEHAKDIQAIFNAPAKPAEADAKRGRVEIGAELAILQAVYMHGKNNKNNWNVYIEERDRLLRELDALAGEKGEG